MAEALGNALRDAAAKVAQYVADVAQMKVETLYVPVSIDGPIDFSQARPIAQTIMSLDGDSKVIVPMRPSAAGGFEVDATLLALHDRNVTTAIEYRARLLHALLSALPSFSQ